uniref:C-type lectin domain-containing protein n=1 Tax=Cyprinus carpio TaxID=7962 RepID=A0A8C2BVS7_CYPCA
MKRLIKTVRRTFYGSAWIGLYDDLNSWRWSLDNTALEGGFKSWFVQQQVNSGGQSLCVYMSYHKGRWDENFCIEHHTDLISIRNETENYRVQSLISSNSGFWIGLYRTRSWSDQSNSSFSNWRTGQPDNAGNSEYCTTVSFSDSGSWTDENYVHAHTVYTRNVLY